MVFKVGFFKFKNNFEYHTYKHFFFNVCWNAIVTFHPMLIEIGDKHVLRHVSCLAITHSIMWKVKYRIKLKYKLIFGNKDAHNVRMFVQPKWRFKPRKCSSYEFMCEGNWETPMKIITRRMQLMHKVWWKLCYKIEKQTHHNITSLPPTL